MLQIITWRISHSQLHWMDKILPKLRLSRSAQFKIHTGGWLSVLIITGATFLLGLNLWRVAINAKESFEVYVFEQQTLEALQDSNSKLEEELEYYSSYEYKQLYARDNLRLGQGSEKLYRILRPQEYYQVPDEEPEFFTEGEYAEWWLELL